MAPDLLGFLKEDLTDDNKVTYSTTRDSLTTTPLSRLLGLPGERHLHDGLPQNL